MDVLRGMQKNSSSKALHIDHLKIVLVPSHRIRSSLSDSQWCTCLEIWGELTALILKAPGAKLVPYSSSLTRFLISYVEQECVEFANCETYNIRKSPTAQVLYRNVFHLLYRLLTSPESSNELLDDAFLFDFISLYARKNGTLARQAITVAIDRNTNNIVNHSTFAADFARFLDGAILAPELVFRGKTLEKACSTVAILIKASPSVPMFVSETVLRSLSSHYKEVELSRPYILHLFYAICVVHLGRGSFLSIEEESLLMRDTILRTPLFQPIQTSVKNPAYDEAGTVNRDRDCSSIESKTNRSWLPPRALSLSQMEKFLPNLSQGFLRECISILEENATVFRGDFEITGSTSWQDDKSRLHVSKSDAVTAHDYSHRHRLTMNEKAKILAMTFDSDNDEPDDTYDELENASAAENPVKVRQANQVDKKGAFTCEPLLYAAYQSEPEVFNQGNRNSLTRRRLLADTGLSNEQIEGWKSMLQRQPTELRKLAIRYAYRGIQTPLSPTRYIKSSSCSSVLREDHSLDAKDSGSLRTSHTTVRQSSPECSGAKPNVRNHFSPRSSKAGQRRRAQQGKKLQNELE